MDKTLFKDSYNFIKRFVIPPSEAAAHVAVAWVGHTHLIHKLYITPRLIIRSPEKASGKTLLATILSKLSQNCNNPSLDSTPQAMWRKIQQGYELSGDGKKYVPAPWAVPTSVLDEVDGLFSSKSRDNSTMVSFINGGWQYDAIVERCKDNSDDDYKIYNAFAPMILTGLYVPLKDTALDRSIIFDMEPQDTSKLEDWFDDPEGYGAEAEALNQRWHNWAVSVEDKVKKSRPEFPKELKNRNKDRWRSLFIVADVADDADQKRHIWDASLFFHQEAMEYAENNVSEGVQLLMDIRDHIEYHGWVNERLPSAKLVEWLALEYTWLTQKKLSEDLKKYKLFTKKERVKGVKSNVATYKLSKLKTVCEKYIPKPRQEEEEVVITSAPTATPQQEYKYEEFKYRGTPPEKSPSDIVWEKWIQEDAPHLRKKNA